MDVNDTATLFLLSLRSFYEQPSKKTEKGIVKAQKDQWEHIWSEYETKPK